MFTLRRSCLALAAAVASTAALTQPAQAVSWADAVTASSPAYWYRFEGTTTAGGVTNQGSTAGFNGAYGAGFTNAELGKPSAFAGLGNAIEFTGPAANQGTTKTVNFGAAIPELTNFRPAVTEKTTTVEYWIKTTQVGGNGGNNWQNPSLLARESPGDGDMYWGNFPANANGEFRFSTSDTNEIAAPNVANDQWHHIVMVKSWDNVGPSTSTLYIDGGAAAGGRTIIANTGGGDGSYQDNDSGIDRLGVTISGELGNVQYIGQVDELAIYNRGLTAQEVANHYRSVATVAAALPNPQPIHRYSFDGTGGIGATLIDSIGGANGVLRGADASALTGTGQLSLGGGSSNTAGYGDLPNGIVSGLTNATLEAWVTWDNANQNWSRVFDFGDNTAGEVTGPGGGFSGNGADGDGYFFLTPGSGTTGNLLGGVFEPGPGETQAIAPFRLSANTEHQIAYVFDDDNDLLQIYVDGTLAAQAGIGGRSLSQVLDLNNWLGRSNFSGDDNFDGLFNEFRIYDTALTAEQIRTSLLNGPNSLGAVPEPASALLGLMGMALLGLRRRRTA